MTRVLPAAERPATAEPPATVVVPAYNEADHITESLQRIGAVVTSALPGRGWEIVVIDDGSQDGTAEAARRAAAPLAACGVRLRLLQHVTNLGLGVALQTGFAASTGEVVVVVDSDLSYHPDHIPELVNALERTGAQVAVASPYMPGGSTIDVPAHLERRSRAANAFLAAAGTVGIATYTGMVRAYDGEFIRGLSLKATDDSINIEALYKTRVLRGRVVEVPAVLDWSGLTARAGRSGIRNRRTRVKLYNTLVNGVLFRPYVAFMTGGLSLMGAGLLLGLGSLALPSAPLGLTVWAATSLATGVLICFAGLISVQVKRYFEELFVLGSRDRLRCNQLVAEQPAQQEEPAPRGLPVERSNVRSAAG